MFVYVQVLVDNRTGFNRVLLATPILKVPVGVTTVNVVVVGPQVMLFTYVGDNYDKFSLFKFLPISATF